jgi:uncharacterized protein YfcZ (UPF0381/DUF406 family)
MNGCGILAIGTAINNIQVTFKILYNYSNRNHAQLLGLKMFQILNRAKSDTGELLFKCELCSFLLLRSVM